MGKRHLWALLAWLLTLGSALQGQAQTFTGSAVGDGEFYLYNVGTGRFLAAGNDYGTRASMGDDALRVTLAAQSDGTYTVSTDPTYSGLYLGSDGYVDKASDYNSTKWTFTAVEGEDNAYTMKSNGYYMYAKYDGSTKTTMQTSLPDDGHLAYAYWKLVTRADMISAIAATDGSESVNATWLLLNPAYGRVTDVSCWTDSPAHGGPDYGNYCLEKWNTTFDVYQTVTDVPNGQYTVKVQGFYRVGNGTNDASAAAAARKAGNEVLNAEFYANNATLKVPSMFKDASTTNNSDYNTSNGYIIDDSGTTYYIPNTMARAGRCFANGLYDNEFLVVVSDGRLTVGVRKSVADSQDWTIWDNFRLYFKPLTSAVYDSLRTAAQQLLSDNPKAGGTDRAALQQAADASTDGVTDFAALASALTGAMSDFEHVLPVVNSVISLYSELDNIKELIAKDDQDDLKALLATADTYLTSDNTTATAADWTALRNELIEMQKATVSSDKTIDVEWRETYISSKGKESSDYDDIFFTQLIDISGADSIQVTVDENVPGRRIYWYKGNEISTSNFVSRGSSAEGAKTETYAIPSGAAYFTYRFSNESDVYKSSSGYYTFSGLSGTLTSEQNALVNSHIVVRLIYNKGKDFGLAAETDSLHPGDVKAMAALFANSLTGDVNEQTEMKSQFSIEDPSLTMGMTITSSRPDILKWGWESDSASVFVSYEDVHSGVQLPFTFTPGADIDASQLELQFFHGNSQFGTATVTWEMNLTTDTEKSVTVRYDFADETPGNAAGTLVLWANAHSWRGDYTVYYGDADGNVLSGYAEIAHLNVAASGETNKVEWAHTVATQLLPTDAKTIVAVNDADASKTGSFAIPAAKQAVYAAPTYRFGCLSDIHLYDGNQSATFCLSDFPRALTYFNSQNVAFTGVCGDLTQTGYTSIDDLKAQLTNFTNLKATANHPVYATNGNHDVPGDGITDAYRAAWIDQVGMPVDTVILLNGDAVIFYHLSAYAFGTNGTPYTFSDLQWLKKQLEKYSDRRVFLWTHVFIPNYAGDFKHLYPEFVQMYGESLSMLQALAAKYPNVISFSGHSHWRYYLQQYTSANTNYYQVPDGMAMVHLSGCASPINGEYSGNDPYDDTTNGWSRGADYGQGNRSEIAVMDVYPDSVIFHGLEFKYPDTPEKDYAGADDYQEVPIARYSIGIPGTLPIGDLGATWTKSGSTLTSDEIGVRGTFTNTFIHSNTALSGKTLTATCTCADGSTTTLTFAVSADTIALTLPENCTSIRLSIDADLSADEMASGTEVRAWVKNDNFSSTLTGGDLAANPADMTSRIKNPKFDYNPANDGSWTRTTSNNNGAFNYGYQELEYYSSWDDNIAKSFTTQQTIANLPAGYYQLSVQAFQRVKENDGAEAYKAGTETIDAQLFAKTADGKKYATKLLSLYDENETGSYNGFANTMEEASNAFASGKYTGNVLTFYQPTDGASVTIGVGSAKTGGESRSWTIIDNYQLRYFGNDAAETILPGKSTETFTPQPAVGSVAMDGRTFSSDKWMTVCLPFSVPTSEIESVFGSGAQVATMVSDADGVITFSTKNPAIRAHQPALVKATQLQAQHAIVEAGDATTFVSPQGTDAALVGNYGYVASLRTLGDDIYVISDNKFYYVDAASTVASYPLRAWFTYPSSSEVKILIDGVETSIEDIRMPGETDEEKASSEIYDLAGRRLQRVPQQGFYIKNGKKYFVK